MSAKTIMAQDDMRRTLARITHEIIERNHFLNNIILVGIKTRGFPLANRLSTSIEQVTGTKVPVAALDILPYRDDQPNHNQTPPHHNGNLNVTGKAVIVVDDVLYTGRSIRAAMDAIIDTGRPQSIQLVVLVDRGHRELPIRPDYVGKNVPSARNEEISVHLKETDGIDEVSIVSQPAVKATTLPKGGQNGA